MKLSLSWIFDHIVNPLSRYDVSDIVERFNKTTAEIEAWQEVHFDQEKFALGKVVSMEQDLVTLHCAEWCKNITLPMRKDAKEGAFFVLVCHNREYRWATCIDWHSTKEGLLPAMFVTPQEESGGWKDHIAAKDYILVIDNKSITHRPDLWGHYGFAREIAAMLKIDRHNQENLYAPLQVDYGACKGSSSSKNPYVFEIKETHAIKALAGMYIHSVVQQESTPWMAYKLCLLDARPINTLVDATNYTMYDIGQPLHAFNAEAIHDKKLIARMAHDNEKITLLDGDTITLDHHDIVIADTHNVLSLAGIMGGKQSGISENVHSLVVEAACFDASTIRRSVTRHKKRTDAAARFEKSLEPHQIIFALRRYATVLRLCGVKYGYMSDIVALGDYPRPHIVTIFHSLIEDRLGIHLDQQKIEFLLVSLDFKVVAYKHAHDIEYTITVPFFRSSKDIRMKEDIVEEIGRTLGYDLLKSSPPCIQASIPDLHALYNRRTIKNVCSNSLRLQEVYTYSLFDEHFLKHIQWQPEQSVVVEKPVSENRQQLVTTLIPQLLAVVAENAPHNDELRFFEFARVWHNNGQKGIEKKSLAGIIYRKKGDVSFYDGKALVDQLLTQLRIDATWHKVDSPKYPWFIPYQTAAIHYKGTVIGHVGLSHPLFFEKIALGAACIFELDGDFLIDHKAEIVRVVALSKFPDVVKDISLLVPLSTTVATLQSAIKTVDPRIVSVELHDFFEKTEWQSHRAVTFRYTIRNYEKTMTKLESEKIYESLVQHLAGYGVQTR